MAKSPIGSAASAGDAPAKRKQTRPLGPKVLWLLFKPGTDPALVAQFNGAVDLLTGTGRKVLEAMSNGTPQPFVKITLQSDKRGGDDVPVTAEMGDASSVA
jgi:hypothetical protein